MGSNREKSYRNIGNFFKGLQKLFRILMVALIFSPTVLYLEYLGHPDKRGKGSGTSASPSSP